MSDDNTTRLWLVEWSYDNRDLIILICAAPDGEYGFREELAAAMMHQRRMIVTVVIDAPMKNFEPVNDDDLRERYVVEATEMADSHEPNDEV